MKRLFGICFLLTTQSVFAQFEEVSYRESFSNYFSEFVRGSNGEFLIGSSYDQGDIASLFNVNSDSAIWQSGYYNVVWDASMNTEGNLVLFVSSVGCDFVQESQLSRLEVASDGQVLTTTNYPYMVYGNWDYGTYQEDGDFYFFWNSIIKIDENGNEVFQTIADAEVTDFQAVVIGHNQDLLAFTGDGLLARFDQFGGFLDTIGLSQPILTAAHSPFGQIFGFSDSTVFEIDTELVVTEISSSLGLSGSIQDFIVDTSGMLLLLEDETLYRIDTSYAISDQTSLTSYLDEGMLWLTDSGYYCSGVLGDFGVIIRLDSDLNIVSDFQMKWMSVRDLNVFDGQVWIVGTESHFPHQYDHPSALLKSFDTDLNTGSWQNDIAILELEVDSVLHGHPQSGIYYRDAYPSIRVQNAGQTVIENVDISYHFSPVQSWMCEYQELKAGFSDLSLQPLADTTLTLSSLRHFYYDQPPNYAMTICAYAYNPDRKMDVDHSNNDLCHAFDPNVGIEELNERGVTIYPNPFDNELIIELGETVDVTTIRVSDVLGRDILLLPDSGNGRINLNTSSWGAGIYFLTIDSKDDKVVRKFVKR